MRDGAAGRSRTGRRLPRLSSAAWVDTIREASERVSALMSAPHVRHPAALQNAHRWQLASALDLLRRERFDEALDQVRAATAREPKAIPTSCWSKRCCWRRDGQLAAAEEACQRLLLIDGLNAGAHYVLALCREHAGECERVRSSMTGSPRISTRRSPCRGCIAVCSRAGPAIAMARAANWRRRLHCSNAKTRSGCFCSAAAFPVMP